MGERFKGYTHPHHVRLWSEAERIRRQDALGIVPVGERLYQHEIETVERLQGCNQIVEWLRRDIVEFKPTNDIRWVNNGGIEAELKATSTKYATISDRIGRAVRRARAAAVVKENFIIDLGMAELRPNLRYHLSRYNVSGSPTRRIASLWILSRGELFQIPLE